MSSLRTRNARDILPDVAYLLVQLLPGSLLLLARGAVGVLLLISFWHPAPGINSGKQRDSLFFEGDDGQLTTYSKAVIGAFVGWVLVRILVVMASAAILWLFSTTAQGYAETLISTAKEVEEAIPPPARRDPSLPHRDPASSHPPAKSWRDELEVQWAWRERSRARLQDAFELCIVRPSRSRLALALEQEKLQLSVPLAALMSPRETQSSSPVLSPLLPSPIIASPTSPSAAALLASQIFTPPKVQYNARPSSQALGLSPTRKQPSGTSQQSGCSVAYSDPWAGSLRELDEFYNDMLASRLQRSAAPSPTSSRSRNLAQAERPLALSSVHCAPPSFEPEMPETSYSTTSLPITSPITPTYPYAGQPIPEAGELATPRTPHLFDDIKNNRLYSPPKGTVAMEVYSVNTPRQTVGLGEVASDPESGVVLEAEYETSPVIPRLGLDGKPLRVYGGRTSPAPEETPDGDEWISCPAAFPADDGEVPDDSALFSGDSQRGSLYARPTAPTPRKSISAPPRTSSDSERSEETGESAPFELDDRSTASPNRTPARPTRSAPSTPARATFQHSRHITPPNPPPSMSTPGNSISTHTPSSAAPSLSRPGRVTFRPPSLPATPHSASQPSTQSSRHATVRTARSTASSLPYSSYSARTINEAELFFNAPLPPPLPPLPDAKKQTAEFGELLRYGRRRPTLTSIHTAPEESDIVRGEPSPNVSRGPSPHPSLLPAAVQSLQAFIPRKEDKTRFAYLHALTRGERDSRSSMRSSVLSRDSSRSGSFGSGVSAVSLGKVTVGKLFKRQESKV